MFQFAPHVRLPCDADMTKGPIRRCPRTRPEKNGCPLKRYGTQTGLSMAGVPYPSASQQELLCGRRHGPRLHAIEVLNQVPVYQRVDTAGAAAGVPPPPHGVGVAGDVGGRAVEEDPRQKDGLRCTGPELKVGAGGGSCGGCSGVVLRWWLWLSLLWLWMLWC